MDYVDEKILDILQQDGRISMQKLAKSLPMSVPATCERVRKLEDAGVITGYGVKLNPKELGRTINVCILFACNPGELDHVVQWVRQEPRIISASLLAGKFAIMMEASCRDMTDYADLIYRLYPLGMSESYIKIDQVKDLKYSFGPDSDRDHKAEESPFNQNVKSKPGQP